MPPDNAHDIAVGFVGIGGLGSALLTRELDCGLRITAFDPRPEATAPFADRATVVASAAEVAAASAVVQVVVNDDEQVLEVLLSPGGVLEGAPEGLIVLVHSTIGHDTLRRAVDACAAAGVTLLDAPVSGAMGQYSIPDMCVMIGGDAAAFQVVEPVLATFASLVVHLGPSGRGLDAKLARNAVGYLFYLVNLEGLRLADAAGIDRETMWRIFDHTGLQGTRGGMSGQPAPDPAKPMAPWPRAEHMTAVAQKDLRAALARAAELRIAMPTTEASIDRMPTVFGADLGTVPA